jgi:hypothetical protein
MMVRTYGFSGCFTRPPGTSTRDHPHEPTASKPVVPGCLLLDLSPSQLSSRFRRRLARRDGHPSSAAAQAPVLACQEAKRRAGTKQAPRPSHRRTTWGAWYKQIDAVPGRLRNLHVRPESLLWLGGAASHLIGLALHGSVPRLKRMYARAQTNASLLTATPRIVRAKGGAARSIRSGLSLLPQ